MSCRSTDGYRSRAVAVGCLWLAIWSTVRWLPAIEASTAGSLDPDFNAGAIDGAVRSIQLQNDHKILIAGDFTSVQATPRRGLARLNANGALDPTFTPAPELSSSASNRITDIALQADGSVIVGGLFDLARPGASTNATHLVVRLQADGSLDWAYGPFLIQRVREPLECLALQPDDKLLVGFRTEEVNAYNPSLPANPASHLARLDRTGRLDTGFSVLSSGPFESGLSARVASQICVEPSGAFLTLWGGGSFSGLLTRCDARGSRATFRSALTPVATGMGPGDLGITRLIGGAPGRVIVNGWFQVQGAPYSFQNGYSVAGLTLPEGSWDHLLALRSSTVLAALPNQHLLGILNGALCALNCVGGVDPLWQKQPLTTGILLALAQPDGRVLVGGSFSHAGHECLLRLLGDDLTPRAPSIRVQPASQILSNTNALLLAVWADGYPLTYQWRRNGVDLRGETNDAIRIEAKPGDFTVVVSNALGRVTSSVAQVGVLDFALALNTPGWTWSTPSAGAKNPSYWQVETNLTHDGLAAAVGPHNHYPNWGTRLETTVPGPGQLTFWHTGGCCWLEVKRAGSRVPAPSPWMVSASLSPDQLQPGPWQLETIPIPAGEHVLGWTPRDFPVDVVNSYLDEVRFVPSPSGSPEIVGRDAVALGADLQLSVRVSSAAGPLSYQWLVSEGLADGWHSIPGATNTTLTATRSASAYYAVVVGNAVGSVVSEPATAGLWAPANGVQISAALDAGQGGVWLTVQGVSGASATVQASVDLRDWRDWATVACTNGTGSLFEPVLGTSTAHFYRAVVQ